MCIFFFLFVTSPNLTGPSLLLYLKFIIHLSIIHIPYRSHHRSIRLSFTSTICLRWFIKQIISLKLRCVRPIRPSSSSNSTDTSLFLPHSSWHISLSPHNSWHTSLSLSRLMTHISFSLTTHDTSLFLPHNSWHISLSLSQLITHLSHNSCHISLSPSHLMTHLSFSLTAHDTSLFLSQLMTHLSSLTTHDTSLSSSQLMTHLSFSLTTHDTSLFLPYNSCHISKFSQHLSIKLSLTAPISLKWFTT